MKKFISTVKNIFSIEDLRVRIVNTIGFLIIFRLGSFIVLPGVDPSKLGGAPEGIFGLIDTVTSGEGMPLVREGPRGRSGTGSQSVS